MVGSGLSRVIQNGEILGSGDCIGCETIISETSTIPLESQGSGFNGTPVPNGSVPRSRRSILEQPQKLNLELPQNHLPETEPQNPVGNRSVSQNTDRMVTEIYIHPDWTRAADVDDQIGHDGLSILLQPRSPKGLILLKPGKATIRMTDPAAPRAQNEIGTWTFTPTELDYFKTVSGRSETTGYQIRLPWSLNTPLGKRLHLSVQYIANDGRILESSRSIRLIPPGENYSPKAPLIAAWTLGTPGENRELDLLAPEFNLNDETGAERRRIKALPAKTDLSNSIKKSKWRPVR